MIDVSALPAVNAGLNATAAVFLVCGFVAVRRGRIGLHRACMLCALAVSTTFLASYLVYHSVHGATRFAGEGLARILYFSVLISHTTLAVVLVPLVIVTLVRALRADFVRHRRIARVTLPIWLYVSVTGVLVYWLLYHVFPQR